MIPQFWKLSQSPDYFTHQEMLNSIRDGLIYVHRDTRPMGISSRSQAQDFVEASLGDYFYLTNGNQGIYLIGQFTGPANIFSAKKDGWLDRPFRLIANARIFSSYQGESKWWTPNFNSTFIKIPPHELHLFEEFVLTPFFDITLREFGVDVPV